jgi:hypothetical protein
MKQDYVYEAMELIAEIARNCGRYSISRENKDREEVAGALRNYRKFIHDSGSSSMVQMRDARCNEIIKNKLRRSGLLKLWEEI